MARLGTRCPNAIAATRGAPLPIEVTEKAAETEEEGDRPQVPTALIPARLPELGTRAKGKGVQGSREADPGPSPSRADQADLPNCS